MTPKFSVSIITFNQEKLIGRALDSIIRQKDYVYEVVICDDCSTDGNWEVILDYQNRFPNLIKAYRNNSNLDISANQHKARTLCTGELIIELAGDDEIENGIFKEISNFVKEKKINYKEEPVSIVCEYRKYPKSIANRKKTNNKIILTDRVNLVNAKLRGVIDCFTCFFSQPLSELIEPVSNEYGRYCDELYDIQKISKAKKVYYCPCVGVIYHVGEGVSTNVYSTAYNLSMDLTDSYIRCNYHLCKCDYHYFDYMHFRRLFLARDNTITSYIKMVYHSLLATNFRYGFYGVYFIRNILDIGIIARRNKRRTRYI